jgi:hypothetical protein
MACIRPAISGVSAIKSTSVVAVDLYLRVHSAQRLECSHHPSFDLFSVLGTSFLCVFGKIDSSDLLGLPSAQTSRYAHHRTQRLRCSAICVEIASTNVGSFTQGRPPRIRWYLILPGLMFLSVAKGSWQRDLLEGLITQQPPDLT